MKHFLLKGGGIMLALMLVYLITPPELNAQRLKFPADYTEECGSGLYLGHPTDVRVLPLDCPSGSETACCGDEPLTYMDGCYVDLDNCLQVALVCVDKGRDGPTYTFKVYNACNTSLDYVSFSLPRGDVDVDAGGDQVQICGSSFQVKQDDDNNRLEFQGKLQPGKSYCFSYTIEDDDDVQDNIVVGTNAGGRTIWVDVYTQYCLENNMVEKVKIRDHGEDGSKCEGYEIERTYIVSFRGPRDPIEHTQQITIKGDEEGPKGRCPEGKTGLRDPSHAPDPSTYIWYFMENWRDDCSDNLNAVLEDEKTVHDDCGRFRVIQKFAISDECGRTSYCEIEHSGSSGRGGDLTGKCPQGKDNLMCIDEVPSDHDIIWLVKESFDNVKEVKIWSKDKEGDDCRFKVTFEVKVIGYCGQSKTCNVVYSGRDKTPPAPKSYRSGPEGESDLDRPEDVPHPNRYMWTIKEGYEDNCGGPIHVEYVGQDIDKNDCGGFTVTQKFKVSDKCGNSTICEVVHTGGSEHGSLVGECPEGKEDLKCLDEVPSDHEIIWLVKESYRNVKSVAIWTKNVEGNDCHFKVRFKVMVMGYCGEQEICWITYSGEDKTAPNLRPGKYCPDGETGLDSPSDVPHSSTYLWEIKNAYEDNCGGPIKVEYIGKEHHGGDCGSFTVTQKYKVSDKCGNYTICKVVHTGSGYGGGSLIGDCPSGKTNLQCIDEVPTNMEVIKLIKDAFENEDMVRILTKGSVGNNCSGFTVSYKVSVKDACGHEEICQLTYKGRDKKAPSFTVDALPDLEIECGETPRFRKPEAVDNCGGEVQVYKLGDDLVIEGDCEASFSVVRTWVAKDACGNVSEPITQTISTSSDCCTPSICAYTPVYWGQHADEGSPNVQELLEANGGSIFIGPFELDGTCIDVVLPGEPVATPEKLMEFCPDGLYSSSLIRHSIALTLNVINNPDLCDALLTEVPCLIDASYLGFDENATVCDLMDAANEALEQEWFDCELADALAAVNECFGCLDCEAEEVADNDQPAPENRESLVTPDLGQGVDLSPEGAFDMEVFPNPSSGLVNLKYSGFEEGRVWIFVHNLAGELVHQTVTDEPAAQVSLDLSGLRLPSGTYFITTTSGRQTASKKIVVDYQR